MLATVPSRLEPVPVLPARDHVPAEWIGRARALRRDIIAAHAIFTAAVETLVGPMRPRERFTPMPRHAALRRILAAWRRDLKAGRLDLHAEFEAGKLTIADLRAVPGDITADAWVGDDEPAVAIVMYALSIAPPHFRENETLVAAIGLHALGRRYQRGADRSDSAVLRDLRALAVRAPEAVRAGGEFQIEGLDGGRWIGAVADTYALVRTFLD